jgi:hypothetical protein
MIASVPDDRGGRALRSGWIHRVWLGSWNPMRYLCRDA